MITFCHRQISIFLTKVLEVTDKGFTFKGKTYQWSDVTGIELRRGSFILSAFMFPAANPKAKISLNDGKSILINGRCLEKSGVRPKINKLTGESDAFLELIDLFESRSGDGTPNTPLEPTR